MLKQAGWNNLKNILCIRLDNLGDVLMTTPAIRALKEQMPGRRITLLSSRAGSTIARYVREIDDIIVFDTPWEKNPDPAARHFAHNLVEQLKQRNFDAAVIFTVYSQNPLPAAMLCYLAGIPRVAGYCRENPYGLITHWIPDEEPVYEIKHEVTRQMDLVKFLGMEAHDDSLSLSVPENTILDTMNRLLKTGIDPDKKWVIIHPGVSEAKRQYPVELFAEAAKTILEDEDMQILLTGTEAEKELTEHIQQTVGPGVFNLAGMLSIGELCAVIKMSSLLIANNTGPVHIAAALNTPVIVLYALTNPQHTPWNVTHRVLPFDVPQERRSKNVIIKLAYERSFLRVPLYLSPKEIVLAAYEIFREKEITKTEILNL